MANQEILKNLRTVMGEVESGKFKGIIIVSRPINDSGIGTEMEGFIISAPISFLLKTCCGIRPYLNTMIKGMMEEVFGFRGEERYYAAIETMGEDHAFAYLSAWVLQELETENQRRE